MADYQQQLDKYRQINEAKAKAAAEAEARKLTPEQVKNWRRVLNGIIGPYAFVMPEDMVYTFRDAYQHLIDEEVKRLSKEKK